VVRFASITGVVCALCCAWTLAQNPGYPASGNPSASQSPARGATGEAFSIGAERARHGGSLAKASLSTIPINARAESAKADPMKARLMAVSFVAVPDPEPKVVQKHDLITIIIREASEYTSDANTELKKSADLDASLQEWIKLDPSNFAIKGGAQGATPPSVKASGSRNFKGEAKVDRTDSFVTRIAAEVLDVKPNGTFVVQARKHIKHDEEEADYVLTGICRAADLTLDNTVLSTQVYNLEIETTHKGAVNDTTKRGLIPKLLDFINPF